MLTGELNISNKTCSKNTIYWIFFKINKFEKSIQIKKSQLDNLNPNVKIFKHNLFERKEEWIYHSRHILIASIPSLLATFIVTKCANNLLIHFFVFISI